MKYRIVFLISVLALLSFSSIELSSFIETNQSYSENVIEIAEEIDAEDEALHCSIETISYIHSLFSPTLLETKRSKLLYYDIFKPPKVTLS